MQTKASMRGPRSATLFGRSLVQDGVVATSLPAAELKNGAGVRAGRTFSSSEPITIGDFIIGAENRLTIAAIDELFCDSGRTYNPLVLVGISGVGKSLLAGAIADRWRREFTRQSIVETTAADFARDFAVAIQNEKLDAFRALYSAARLVIIDDLTQLVAKRAALAELASLIDAWLSLETQVVLTSKLPPDEIAAFPQRLIGRLTSGLVLSLALPGLETRREIIHRQASARGISIELAAVDLLADELPGTAPELLAALLDLQLNARTEKTSGAITPELVRAYFARQKPGGPNLRGIASLTAKYFGLKVSDLTSPSRRRAVVTARGVAMYLARELTGKSLEQVGAHFGGRDHTTVLHSYRTTEKRLRTDPGTRKAVTDLRSKLAIG